MRRFLVADGMRQPNFAVLAALALLVIAINLLARTWAGTAETLSETDDALRLVQMRDFLAGQGWFDLHQPRLGLGYESHWSRLIDAGLAGLFLLFHQFADTALAERLMRVAWPLLWLVPTVLGAAAIAWRLAGRPAAVVTLLFAVVGMPAFQQFLPGNIDHHNVQIALVVLTLAAAVWSDRRPWTAAAAGALTGLAMGVGLESLPFLALCGAGLAARYVVDRDGAGALARYGGALAASTAAAFLVSIGPDHWGRSVCDAIAINWAAPTVCAGLMLFLAADRFAGAGVRVRGLTVAVIGATAAAIFLGLEPRCIGGPYAMMDPALRSIWLSHVTEMQPVLAIARSSPAVAAAIVAFPAAALIATLVLAGEAELRRDLGFVLPAAVLIVAFALTMAVAKVCMYAMWFGMPLVAAATLRLFARLRLVNLALRTFVAMALSPALLSAGAIATVQAAGAPAIREHDNRVLGGCFKSANYAQLAQLPRGIIATDIDYGSFVLALTPHAVVGAPYHRLSAGIMAAHQAFALPPEEARRVLARFGTTYVVTCGKREPPGLSDAERRASLGARLQAGSPPDWLQPVPAGPGQVFAVYRVTGNGP